MNIIPAQSGSPELCTWIQGATTSGVGNLAPGQYSVSIMDGNNCLALLSVTIAEPQPFGAWTTASINPVCVGEATGTISAGINGATLQTYAYADVSGNMGTCAFEIVVADAVNFQDVQVSNDVDEQGLGSIAVTVYGGTAGYVFEWTSNNQVIGTTEDLTGLNAGFYTLQITDAQSIIPIMLTVWRLAKKRL